MARSELAHTARLKSLGIIVTATLEGDAVALRFSSSVRVNSGQLPHIAHTFEHIVSTKSLVGRTTLDYGDIALVFPCKSYYYTTFHVKRTPNKSKIRVTFNEYHSCDGKIKLKAQHELYLGKLK